MYVCTCTVSQQTPHETTTYLVCLFTLCSYPVNATSICRADKTEYVSQDEFVFINGGYMMVMKSKLNVVRTNNVVIMAIPSCREYWPYPRVVNIGHILML